MTDFNPNALTGAVIALTLAVLLVGIPRHLEGRRLVLTIVLWLVVLSAVSL